MEYSTSWLDLILPPSINLILVLLAWVFWRSRRRIARSLLLLSATSLYVIATPSIAQKLADMLPVQTAPSLETIKSLHSSNFNEGQAPNIVVIGAGRKVKAAEYEWTDTVNSRTLELLRYAAFLHRKTELDVVVMSNPNDISATEEAVLMNQSLLEDFDVPVKKLFANYNTNYLESNSLLVVHSATTNLPEALSSDSIVISFSAEQMTNDTVGQFVPSAHALSISIGALKQLLLR